MIDMLELVVLRFETLSSLAILAKEMTTRIVGHIGPVSFRVELEHEGLIWRRHQDLIRKRHVDELPFHPVELEIPEDDSPECTDTYWSLSKESSSTS